MPVTIIDWPVIDYNNQSVTVPGTKKPGQTGVSPLLRTRRDLNAYVTMQYQLTIAMVW